MEEHGPSVSYEEGEVTASELVVGISNAEKPHIVEINERPNEVQNNKNVVSFSSKEEKMMDLDKFYKCNR